MKKVVFTNSRGESVELFRQPLFLSKIEGIGDVSADVQNVKAPYQDGTTNIDVIMNERYITMEVDITHDFEANMEKLSRIFNPKLGAGVLAFTNSRGTKYIKAIAEHVPTYPDIRPIVTQKAYIDLICPNPHWGDSNPDSAADWLTHKLEDFVNNFQFPFTFPVRFATRGDMGILVNSGSEPTPVRIEFRGPVTNPQITNMTTGEWIRVKREIPEGYKLLLDTSFGNKRVEIVGPDGSTSNAFHYIDLSSTFFLLEVGENRLGFLAEEGSPEVYVSYRNIYSGV